MIQYLKVTKANETAGIPLDRSAVPADLSRVRGPADGEWCGDPLAIEADGVWGNTKKHSCWWLMCCRECQPTFTHDDIVDLLLTVRNPQLRDHLLQQFHPSPEELILYLPTLILAVSLELTATPYQPTRWLSVADYLIDHCIHHPGLRYQFYYALLIKSQKEKPYSSLLAHFIHCLLKRHSKAVVEQMGESFKLVFALERFWVDQRHHPLVGDTVYPLDPSLTVGEIFFDQMNKKNSSTQPIVVPVKVYPSKRERSQVVSGDRISTVGERTVIRTTTDVHPTGDATRRVAGEGTGAALGTSPDYDYAQTLTDKLTNSHQLHLMYKKEDLRRDLIVSNIIKMMDLILKRSGYDLNIITYPILPTSPDGGLIQLVEGCETLYNLKYKKHYSILNYIMENNEDRRIMDVRDRFIQSTAAYCVMTYLLGIGNRHLDNIMVTEDGKLFHIDYSFVLGNDPKPLAPKMRIIPEMVEALGGFHSKYYKRFEGLCGEIYDVLRRHATLFMNMLTPLTTLDNKFDVQRLEDEISLRFLPAEYKAQAKVHLMKTINDSTQSSNLIDLLHYQSKEFFSPSGLYRSLRGLINL